MRRKPRVACIFSHGGTRSVWSHDTAAYVGAALQLGGYSDVHLVPYNGPGEDDETPSSPPPAIVPMASRVAALPNLQEYRYSRWDALSGDPPMNLLLVFVDSGDTESCAKRLSITLPEGQDVCVISLQQGVRNAEALHSKLDSVTPLVLAGAVGVSVGRRSDGSLQCLMSRGSLAVERISKDKSAIGEKFLDLLESSGIPLLFRRNIAQYTNGMLAYELYQGAAALCGLSFHSFVYNRECRRTWSILLREALSGFAAASGPGWEPLIACTPLKLGHIASLLEAPGIIFVLLAPLLIGAQRDVVPFMRTDLEEGRETSLKRTVDEMVALGRRHKTDLKSCTNLREMVTSAFQTRRTTKKIPKAVRPEELVALVLSASRERSSVPLPAGKWGLQIFLDYWRVCMAVMVGIISLLWLLGE